MQRRTHEEIRQHLEELDSGVLTVAEFAERIGVSVATVYNWRRKTQHLAPPQPVRLIRQESPSRSAADSGLILQLPGHLQCRLEPGFDPHTLQQLVSALRPLASC